MNTPLIHAARGGHARCLQLLLEHVHKVTVRVAMVADTRLRSHQGAAH